MSEIEKRARELLAAEYERYGDLIGATKARGQMPADGVTLRALVAALTPPDERSLAAVARAALPFIAYAFAKGVDGAEQAGRAIETALSGKQPEGVVLVPEVALRHLLSDAITAGEFIGGRSQSKALSDRVTEQAWALMLALPAAKVPHG